jgi:hypothetical protein
VKIKLSKKDSKLIQERTTLCLEAGRAVTVVESGLRFAAHLLSPSRARVAKVKAIEMQDLSAAVFTSSKLAKSAGNAFRTMERGLRRPRYAVAEARALVIEKKAAELNQAIRKIPRVTGPVVPELRGRVADLIKSTRDLWAVTRLVCENPIDEAR